MKYTYLKAAGLRVSKLCFGTLTISPLQRDFDIKTGSALLKSAYDLGVTFFDTAEIYGTYPHLKDAFSCVDDVVISTKCYAYDVKTAKESLEKAQRGLGRDVIDVMMLHEQESVHTLRGHREAIDYFCEQREKGIIKAFGVSTHFAACVDAAADLQEIDVIHPIYNMRGLGIADGTRQDMERAMKKAKASGKFMFAMKPLGGGHMCADAKAALTFAADSPLIDSVAVGMQTKREVADNAAFFSGQRDISFAPPERPRRLMIHDWCLGCGKCVDVCQQGALELKNGKIEIEQARCVFCGYCAAACPEFAIKVI